MKPLTEEQYQKLRAEAIASHISFIGAIGGKPPKPEDVKLTCDNCSDRLTCEYTCDDYNTNGDCLGMK